MPGSDGRPVIEYIRDVYHELMALGEGRRRPGDREDISSDSGDEGLRDRQAGWSNAPLNKSSAALLRHWLTTARRRRALKKLVEGTIRRACGDTCALCGCTTAGGNVMRCDLALDGKASDHAIDELIKGFEIKYPGRKFEPNLWSSYFRTEVRACFFFALLLFTTKVLTKTLNLRVPPNPLYLTRTYSARINRSNLGTIYNKMSKVCEQA